MTEFLIYFTSTFFFSLFILKFFLSKNNGDILKIYDYPNQRKIHDRKILKIGGIGILFSCLFILCLYRIINEEQFFEMSLIEGQILIATIFLVLGGIADDIVGLNAPKKLFFQVIAILLIIKSGFIITVASSLYVNMIVSVAFYIIVINSMNLIDGIDGLSTGLFLLFVISILFMGLHLEILDTKYHILIVIFLASLSSFLFLNFPPAKIFLGDTGSQLLGWIMAVSIVYLSSFFDSNYQKLYLLSFISLPFYDVIFVMIKRFHIAKGNSIKRLSRIVYPDQNHIHHLLLKNKFNSVESLRCISIFFLFCLLISLLPIYLKAYYVPVFLIVLIFNIAFRLFFELKSKEQGA